jgi:hypothetical protein
LLQAAAAVELAAVAIVPVGKAPHTAVAPAAVKVGAAAGVGAGVAAVVVAALIDG